MRFGAVTDHIGALEFSSIPMVSRLITITGRMMFGSPISRRGSSARLAASEVLIFST
jgi:hypothetical protein